MRRHGRRLAVPAAAVILLRYDFAGRLHPSPFRATCPPRLPSFTEVPHDDTIAADVCPPGHTDRGRFCADPTKTAGTWPQWRGPNRDDVSKEKGLLAEWPKGGPKLLWTFDDAGTGYSGFAVVGDRMYTMGADEKTEYLFALDLKTRKKLWSAEIGPRFSNGYGDGPRGTPTVDGDSVFALGGQGFLVCVKTGTGDKVWTKRLKQDLDGVMMSGWGYTESPLVDGDQVVVTPGGNKGAVAALDKKTGEVLWQSKEFTDKAAYSSLVPANIGGVRQYVQMTGESVAGVAAKDGALLWRFAAPQQRRRHPDADRRR